MPLYLPGTLQPNGTTIDINFYPNNFAWDFYRPDKIRIRCSAKWRRFQLISATGRVMVQSENLNIEANEWHTVTIPWNDAQNERGFQSVRIERDRFDPTLHDLGAVMTDMEFGPQILEESTAPV